MPAACRSAGPGSRRPCAPARPSKRGLGGARQFGRTRSCRLAKSRSSPLAVRKRRVGCDARRCARRAGGGGGACRVLSAAVASRKLLLGAVSGRLAPLRAASRQPGGTVAACRRYWRRRGARGSAASLSRASWRAFARLCATLCAPLPACAASSTTRGLATPLTCQLTAPQVAALGVDGVLALAGDAASALFALLSQARPCCARRRRSRPSLTQRTRLDTVTARRAANPGPQPARSASPPSKRERAPLTESCHPASLLLLQGFAWALRTLRREGAIPGPHAPLLAAVRAVTSDQEELARTLSTPHALRLSPRAIPDIPSL